jgi:bifunctional DNase/RNase
MTHDLFVTVLESVGASITRVLIDELEGGIYYARLSILGDSKQSEIDARPSDCLALALRVKAPIEVREKVISASSIDRSDAERLIGLDKFLE